MPTSRVTIRDVAAEAGVSITTVSHALNGKGEVDPATRRHVTEVASRLGYRASTVARALRAGRTGTIALMLPALGGHASDQELIGLDYYMRLATGACRRAFSAGFPLLLAPYPASMRDLGQLNADGVIICDPGRADPRIAAFSELGIPVVTVERDAARPEVPYVAGDNVADTRLLLDHLAAAGADRIALLAPDADWAWATEATSAYLAWTREQNRPTIMEPTSLHDLEASGHDKAMALLQQDDRPDAILTLAELHASGAARAARELGLRIPADLLLASGIDTPVLVRHDPPITALDLRPELRGATATETLLARITQGRTPPSPIISGELIIRASTRLR
jgi:DNA-binding LacI/PurR family transcriptional regulator